MVEYQPDDWVRRASEGPLIGRAVYVLTSVAAVVALLVVVTTLVTDRPVHWAHWPGTAWTTTASSSA